MLLGIVIEDTLEPLPQNVVRQIGQRGNFQPPVNDLVLVAFLAVGRQELFQCQLPAVVGRGQVELRGHATISWNLARLGE
jgi:hypothetical protein